MRADTTTDPRSTEGSPDVLQEDRGAGQASAGEGGDTTGRDAGGTVGLAAVTVLGRGIGAVFAGVSRVRRAAKPLHPVGAVTGGVLTRHGSGSGVAWIDEPGRDDVLLRLSRSVGVPTPGPDVPGLALRVPVDGRQGGAVGDLLFSGTGTGPLSRFVFLPSLRVVGRAMGTVLPYRSPGGPLLLLADPVDEGTLELRWAVGRGPWTRFATLEVGSELAPDAPVSFDAVRHTLPGLTPYPWVQRLREPSYRSARQHRGLPD